MFEPTGAASSSGGGGGGSIVWSEASNSPVYSFENNADTYVFGAGLAQQLFTVIKVPNSYTAGGQINLRIQAYTPASSGTVGMLAQSTLIRAGTDAITSTTNQRTTTNSAWTAAAGTVKLYRDSTDTCTSDAFFLVLSSEVTFS